MKKNRINMRLVAQELGISPMTVSRALNGSPLVKEETRALVVAKIQELGYDVEKRLRSLQKDRQKNVAIHCGEEKITGVCSYDFFMQLHYFCVNQLKKKDMISHTLDLNIGDPTDFSSLSKCSILLLLSPLKPQVWKKIKTSYPDLKTVNLFGEIDGLTTVLPNDTEGGEIAGTYVAKKGHTHVAVFLDPAEKCFRHRHAGFIAGIQSVNRDATVDSVLFDNPPDQKEADRLKTEVLDSYFSEHKDNLPSAFFVPNCYAAIYLYNYLKEKGIMVPDSIGLVGYDNLDYYQLIDRDISRIYFEVKDLAMEAVHQVCSPGKTRTALTITLPVSFIDAKSVLPITKMRKPKRLEER